MSDPITGAAILQAAPALLQGAGSIMSGISGFSDREVQMAALEYTKRNNQRLRKREDNAIQRRVADLRKAGLNPVLAAGQGAAASAATPLPQVSSGLDKFGAGLSGVGKSVADGILLQKQLDRLDAENDKIRAETGKIKAEKDRLDNLTPLETIEKQLANDLAKLTNPMVADKLKAEIDLIGANRLNTLARTETEQQERLLKEIEARLKQQGIKTAELENQRRRFSLTQERAREEVEARMRAVQFPEHLAEIALRAQEFALRAAQIAELEGRVKQSKSISDYYDRGGPGKPLTEAQASARLTESYVNQFDLFDPQTWFNFDPDN